MLLLKQYDTERIWHMKRFLRCISLSLVLVLILQMLPETRLNVHAEEASDLRTSTSDEIQNNTGADTKLSDVHIVGEVESLREEDTKHFRMSDGSFTAVSYNSPVHYQDILIGDMQFRYAK